MHDQFEHWQPQFDQGATFGQPLPQASSGQERQSLCSGTIEEQSKLLGLLGEAQLTAMNYQSMCPRDTCTQCRLREAKRKVQAKDGTGDRKATGSFHSTTLCFEQTMSSFCGLC